MWILYTPCIICFLQFEISVGFQSLPAAYLVCSYLSFQEAARNGARVACLDFVKPTPQGTTWGEDKSFFLFYLPFVRDSFVM